MFSASTNDSISSSYYLDAAICVGATAGGGAQEVWRCRSGVPVARSAGWARLRFARERRRIYILHRTRRARRRIAPSVQRLACPAGAATDRGLYVRVVDRRELPSHLTAHVFHINPARRVGVRCISDWHVIEHFGRGECGGDVVHAREGSEGIWCEGGAYFFVFNVFAANRASPRYEFPGSAIG